MRQSFTIESLSAAHDRRSFSCGSVALDRYLAEFASQDVKRRLSNCFVMLHENRDVAGYYTLAAASIPADEIPEADRRRLPRYPLLPAALIGRLAIDTRFQSRHLGSALLLDAASRSARADPAIFAILVEAKDESAAAFYRHIGFLPFVARPLTFFIPLATALKALDGGT